MPYLKIVFAALLGMQMPCIYPVQAASSSPEQLGVTVHEQLERIMQEQSKQGFSGVVFIAKNDRVFFHRAYGLADRKTNAAMRQETIISSGSLSKQVTATAAVLLQAQGRLALSDRLSKYFEAVPKDKANITIKQLLSHSAGLHPWVFPDDFTPISQQHWLDMVFQRPLQHQPGAKYLYSNDGFTLVAIIIEKITGLGFKDYVRETLFKPNDMSQTGWFGEAKLRVPSVSVATGYFNGKDDGAPGEWPAPNWALLGNGGIVWSASDMFRWHTFLHSSALTETNRALLFEPIIPLPGPVGDMKEHYALGWRVGTNKCDEPVIHHSGAGISHNVDYRYFPQQDLLIYVASNKIDKDYSGHERMYAKLAANAVSSALAETCEPPLAKEMSR